MGERRVGGRETPSEGSEGSENGSSGGRQRQLPDGRRFCVQTQRSGRSGRRSRATMLRRTRRRRRASATSLGERRPGVALARRPRPPLAPRRRRSAGRLTASTSALASPCDVVGLDQPARLAVRRRCRPGRSASTAIAGSPQAIALDEHLAELLAHRRQDDHVGRGQDVRQLVVVVPAGEEDVAGADALDRVAAGARPPTRPGSRRRARAARGALKPGRARS